MVTITARPGRLIPLGREGENLARQIVFDVSAWQAEYGPGTVSLIARRSGEDDPYPCAVTVDGAQAAWPVTAADTARPGSRGRCELQYRVDGVLVKSESWHTFVADALGEPVPEPPEPQQAWVDRVLEAGRRAQDAAVNPPRLGESGTWLVWDLEAGEYADTGTAAAGPAGERGPQGETGPRGEAGADGYTPQRGVDYWTAGDVETIQAYIDGQLGVIENGAY